jgi:hypothetical protein
MIRQPKARPTCPVCCTCEPCADDLTVWLGDLPARDGDRLTPWDLNRRSVWPTNRGAKRNG